MNVNFNTLTMRHQTSVKSQINLEKISSISSSISIIKRKTFSSSNIENRVTVGNEIGRDFIPFQ